MSDKSADAPPLAFNLREGIRRLLIVLAIASACSIGATTWTWIAAERALSYQAQAYENYLTSMAAGAAFEQDVMTRAAKSIAEKTFETWKERYARFLSFRKWTVIYHLIAVATGLLLWIMSGFATRQKASLTIATDPPRQTGSADTGPPADREG